MFGDNLEDAFGSFFFLSFYLIGGVFAALMHAFLSDVASRQLPCIGASGAISAAMGGYIVLFPRARVKILAIFFVWYRFLKVNVLIFAGFWFLGQFLMVFFNVLDGVAYGAHIGGFSFGLIAAYIFSNYFRKNVSRA